MAKNVPLDPKMALKKTQIEASIELKRQELLAELELKRTETDLKRLEGNSTAKEVASKVIGKTAVPWIVLLVIVGVVSSAFLPSESLPAVIGLVSTAVMAMISMLAGITGTTEKEEKPEIEIIKSLIKQLDETREAMNVEIDGDNVMVSKGDTTMKTSGKKRGR
jgi:hypothetical protein